jgi:hypothetical protein
MSEPGVCEMTIRSTPPSLGRVQAVWHGRDAGATRELYVELAMCGTAGTVAVDLFRASKNSTMAKGYRSGRATRSAYETKQWAIGNITGALNGKPGAELGWRWGWKRDPAQRKHATVLYVDLPTGQVSFHIENRGDGPDYPAAWDASPPGTSAERIILLAAMLLDSWPMPNRLAEIAAIPDSAIDTSDIPELTADQASRLADPEQAELPL